MCDQTLTVKCDLWIALQVFDEAFRSEFPAVTRWFMTLANQPQFATIIGPVKLCETPRKYTREHASPVSWHCAELAVHKSKGSQSDTRSLMRGASSEHQLTRNIAQIC